MLHFSRWKALAIVGTTLIVCSAALTNALPAATFDALPSWAQRKITLGRDFAGGNRYQLAIDRNDMRRRMAEQLRDDVRTTLRLGRVGYTGLVIRDNGVEVRVREESDFTEGLTRLRELAELPSAPRKSTPSVHFVARRGEASLTAGPRSDLTRLAELDIDGRLIKLTLTSSALDERVKHARNRSADMLRRRLDALGSLGVKSAIEAVGIDRIVVETPASADRWLYIIG